MYHHRGLNIQLKGQGILVSQVIRYNQHGSLSFCSNFDCVVLRAGGDTSQGRDSASMVTAKEDSLPDDEAHAAFVRLQAPSQAPLPTGDRSHPHGRHNMHPLALY